MQQLFRERIATLGPHEDGVKNLLAKWGIKTPMGFLLAYRAEHRQEDIAAAAEHGTALQQLFIWCQALADGRADNARYMAEHGISSSSDAPAPVPPTPASIPAGRLAKRPSLACDSRDGAT